MHDVLAGSGGNFRFIVQAGSKLLKVCSPNEAVNGKCGCEGRELTLQGTIQSEKPGKRKLATYDEFKDGSFIGPNYFTL